MKRWASLFAVLYCLRSDGVYLSFSGMDQSTVDTLVSQDGFSCQYVTVDDYNTAVASQQAAQQAAQQAQEVYLAPFRVELATTAASLIGKTTGYVAASAITQVNINAKMARISELRAILGLQ